VGRVEGKVAFITGAARGQGRSHAVRLAQEGADIIAVDLGTSVDGVPYPMGSRDDMAETVEEVEALGRRIISAQVDVRDYDALKAALDEGVAQFGRLDIVAANAGILSFGMADALSEQDWQSVIDVNLTGVWHTAKAAIPHMRDAGRGGSIILTSSYAGLKGVPNIAHYVAARHGVVGLMRTLALELGPHWIRVNSVHPGGVDTVMIQNEAVYALSAPELMAGERTKETMSERRKVLNVLPIPFVEPVDVSNAVLWLASDEARYVTGVALPIDGGSVIK
jgi:SDR family mycofactocin-dependent oxidoreductase